MSDKFLTKNGNLIKTRDGILKIDMPDSQAEVVTGDIQVSKWGASTLSISGLTQEPKTLKLIMNQDSIIGARSTGQVYVIYYVEKLENSSTYTKSWVLADFRKNMSKFYFYPKANITASYSNGTLTFTVGITGMEFFYGKYTYELTY